MSLLPIALIGLLLAGAALLAFAARPLPSAVGAPVASLGRSPLLPTLAAAILALALLVWFLARAGAQVAAWQLTGVALWLLVAVVAGLFVGRRGRPRPTAPMAAAFALAAATLPPLWVADERARVGAVALFAVVWLAVWQREAHGDAFGPAGGLAVAVLLLWAAAVGAWAAALAVAAAAMLLALRPWGDGLGDTAPLLAGLPGVVGAAVLLPWLRAGALPAAVVAAATAMGLLGLLVGLARLGASPGGVGLSGSVARALAPALGGLALAAGVWAGEVALVSAIRLAVLAPAVLWLLAPGESSRLARRLSRLLPLAVVYLALAGLPLTAGFAALSPLYATWLPNGWVLVVALVALLSLWLAVVYQSGRPARDVDAPVAGNRALWLGAIPAGLAALGLLRLDMAAFAQPLLVWPAVVAPALFGVALSRFVPALSQVGGLLREAVGVNAALGRVGERLGPPARRAGTVAADALADAASILDGQNGLLFLMGLLLLLLWIGR